MSKKIGIDLKSKMQKDDNFNKSYDLFVTTLGQY